MAKTKEDMESLTGYHKHIPADVEGPSKNVMTFLTDGDINTILYGYLLSISTVIDGRTVTKKKDIMTTKELDKYFKFSLATYYRHLNYLLGKTKKSDRQYIKETTIGNDKVYEFVYEEKYFYKIPIETLVFFNLTIKDDVLKTFVYLAYQFNRHKNEYNFTGYDFTLTELGEHIGLPLNHNCSSYNVLWSYLEVLQRFGALDIVQYYDNKKLPHLKVVRVTENKSDFITTPRKWKKQNGDTIEIRTENKIN